MDAQRYLTCLWPGLSELWYRGRPGGLPAAIAFAAALNFLLVARFLYPEWLAPLLVRIGCWAAIAVWLVSVVRAVRELPALLDPRSASGRPDRFVAAQQQYLRGHWVEAETLLTECLEIESRDPPALLLLAGVYRHTGRLDAAAAALDQLERMEAAQGWWLERRAERARLTRSLGVASAPQPDAEKESASGDPEAAVADDGQQPAAANGHEAARDAGAAPDDAPAGADRGTDAVSAEATDQILAAELAAGRS